MYKVSTMFLLDVCHIKPSKEPVMLLIADRLAILHQGAVLKARMVLT